MPFVNLTPLKPQLLGVILEAYHASDNCAFKLFWACFASIVITPELVHLKSTYWLCVSQDTYAFACSPEYGTLLLNYMAVVSYLGLSSGLRQGYSFIIWPQGVIVMFLLSVKDPFFVFSLLNYHLRRTKKYIYLIFCIFYCIVSYYIYVFVKLYNIEIGECWYDATKKTNQLLHLISWTNQVGSEIYIFFVLDEILVENVTCHCIFRTDLSKRDSEGVGGLKGC